MLHFRPKQWHIGDVHPFCHNGLTYLYYLVPNGTLRCDACFANPEHVVCRDGAVAVTADFVHWQECALEHAILNVLPWQKDFLSCFTTGVLCRGQDMIHWQPELAYTCQPQTPPFPGGTRDHSLFYDTDLHALRQTATAYHTNEHSGCGHGMDCGVMATGPLSSRPCTQRMLIHFPNTARSLYTCLEPECSQMLRMGKRWALLTSLARQSVHWVGAPSLWLGREDTPIDAQDWNGIQPMQLDGEDLCAAQMAVCAEHWLLFGWIPLDYRDQVWGGDLNLPREIYLLPDGRPGSRLEPAYAQRIRGDVIPVEIYPTPDESFGVLARAGRRLRNFGVHADFAATPSGIQGILIDADNGIAAEFNRHSRVLRIVSRGQGRETFVFSHLTLDDGMDGAPMHMHVLYVEDIVEVFVNDRYALCARINIRCRESSFGMFAAEGTQLLGMTAYRFREDAQVYTPGVQPVPFSR